MTTRSDCNGTVQERGDGVFRLKYWVNGRQHSTTHRGTKADAKKELRRLIGSVDTGNHVDPIKLTVETGSRNGSRQARRGARKLR
jgi:hypothetical protein